MYVQTTIFNVIFEFRSVRLRKRRAANRYCKRRISLIEIENDVGRKLLDPHEEGEREIARKTHFVYTFPIICHNIRDRSDRHISPAFCYVQTLGHRTIAVKYYVLLSIFNDIT